MRHTLLLLCVFPLLGASENPPSKPEAPPQTVAPATKPDKVATPDKPTTKPEPKSSTPFDTRDQYDVRQIEGWRIIVNKKLLHADSDLAADTLKLLENKLYAITREVPPPALAKLRQITIWVELAEPHTPCMCYHPDAGWLRDHGMNPEKAKCVELANAHNFLTWSHEQPWMVLHELSHGYHDQFLPGGYENKEILAIYHHAMEAKLYDSVLRVGGRTERAYAATNPMEYFAESCEAFFGTNDFYPFVKTELRKHDPECYEALKKLWGVDLNR